MSDLAWSYGERWRILSAVADAQCVVVKLELRAWPWSRPTVRALKRLDALGSDSWCWADTGHALRLAPEYVWRGLVAAELEARAVYAEGRRD